MGTSLLPEPGELETPVVPPVSIPAPETPVPEPSPVPTPTNTAPVNPELSTLMAQGYQEEVQRRMRIEREFEEYRRNKEAPASSTVAPVTDDNFFNTPVSNIRQIIQEELSKSVAPIAANSAAQRRASDYAALKAQVRASGALPDFDRMEGRIDQAMANQEVTFENFKNALIYVRGLMSFEAPTAPVETVRTPVTPPYIPPSPPTAPANTQPVNSAPLTETERRIMRQSGFATEAEFRAWQAMDNNKILADLTPTPAK